MVEGSYRSCIRSVSVLSVVLNAAAERKAPNEPITAADVVVRRLVRVFEASNAIFHTVYMKYFIVVGPA